MPKHKPDDIDRYVAAEIRKHRRAAEWSQERLGDLIGVSFQQVQKTERGVNRTSAGRLFVIAQAFGVPVADFFPKE